MPSVRRRSVCCWASVCRRSIGGSQDLINAVSFAKFGFENCGLKYPRAIGAVIRDEVAVYRKICHYNVRLTDRVLPVR